MRLIVTRPAEAAAAWVEELRALGVDACALPLIAIEPLADRSAVVQAWQTLPGLRLVMFVSASAVAHFFAARHAGAAWPATALAGATGPGTVHALRAAGVPEAVIVAPAPEAGRFDSEALWERLRAQAWRGARVLVVRGEDGRDWLADMLRGAGAEVAFVAAYRRTLPALDDAARALLAAVVAAPRAHVFAFSSSEAVANLRRLVPAADWAAASAIATHPRIAAAARAAGFGAVSVVAPFASAAAAWVQCQAGAGQQGPLDRIEPHPPSS